MVFIHVTDRSDFVRGFVWLHLLCISTSFWVLRALKLVETFIELLSSSLTGVMRFIRYDLEKGSYLMSQKQ